MRIKRYKGGIGVKRLLAVFIGLLCLLTGLCGCGPGAPESSAASREESAVSAPSQGETTASTVRTRPTEPDDGFDDVCPEFPSRTYEYVSTKEQSLEEIVDALVKLYLEDMMTPRTTSPSPSPNTGISAWTFNPRMRLIMTFIVKSIPDNGSVISHSSTITKGSAALTGRRPAIGFREDISRASW